MGLLPEPLLSPHMQGTKLEPHVLLSTPLLCHSTKGLSGRGQLISSFLRSSTDERNDTNLSQSLVLTIVPPPERSISTLCLASPLTSSGVALPHQSDMKSGGTSLPDHPLVAEFPLCWLPTKTLTSAVWHSGTHVRGTFNQLQQQSSWGCPGTVC